jgi:hypothetical protein
MPSRVIGIVVALAAAWALWGASLAATPTAAGAAKRPSVVLIVFDAFPTVSLLDARGRIDRVHYPRFAELAGDSNWYPYATTSVDETGRAFREIFTSRSTWRFAKPTYARHPKNLCTMLRRKYRIVNGEESTAFCPGVEPKTQDEILALLDMGRPKRFLGWADLFQASSRPTFHVKHVLLPHEPRVFLPSGRTYAIGQSENGLPAAAWTHTPWLIQQSYQRHLLQLQYTDLLLGQVLDRLEATGLYDRSLIVVTADHGESFGLPGEGRDIRAPGHAIDVALKPLLVKLPGQHRGKIVRRHVRSIDIAPTIARVTRLRPRWRMQGRSLIGPSARRIPGPKAIFDKGGARVPLGSLAKLRRRMAQSLGRKLRIFGTAGAFGIGPHRELHGTQVPQWPALPQSALRAQIDSPAQFRGVQLGSPVPPVKVSGRLVGPGSDGRLDLAIAVNGRIEATAPAFRKEGSAVHIFSSIVPEPSLRAGANTVQVFAIEGAGPAVSLRLLGAT